MLSSFSNLENSFYSPVNKLLSINRLLFGNGIYSESGMMFSVCASFCSCKFRWVMAQSRLQTSSFCMCDSFHLLFVWFFVCLFVLNICFFLSSPHLFPKVLCHSLWYLLHNILNFYVLLIRRLCFQCWQSACLYSVKDKHSDY